MDGTETAPQAKLEIDGPLLSAGEVAQLFKVHPSTIRRLARVNRAGIIGDSRG